MCTSSQLPILLCIEHHKVLIFHYYICVVHHWLLLQCGHGNSTPLKNSLLNFVENVELFEKVLFVVFSQYFFIFIFGGDTADNFSCVFTS